MNLPFDRSDLDSVAYWHESDVRRAQHFYIGFCLLMSSIQDALLGQRELVSRNLNWSATCSYYSMVHAGRVLFFLPFGDFPTQHDRLKYFLNPERAEQQQTTSGKNPYPFNWLRAFTDRKYSQRTQPHAMRTNWLEEIVNYFLQLRVADADTRVRRFGQFLTAGKLLREDSNYEALLIGHEYQHKEITEAFELLAKNMGIAAEYGVNLAIDGFRGFLEQDADLANERNSYMAFTDAYALGRIRQPLSQKLAALEPRSPLRDKLEGYLMRLCPKPVEGASFGHLVNYVSMENFEGKTGRMRRFREKIDALSDLVV